MPHRRPPQLINDCYIGAVRIFFTMCTFHREERFADATVAGTVRDQLLQTSSACSVEIIAYCFMPDHMHALLAGTLEASNIKGCVQLFRQTSGYHYRRLYKNRLWQEGYFDRHLRNEESTYDVVSYIVSNPVRKKLCVTVSEYPFSGSSKYSLLELAESVQFDSLG